MGPFVLSLARSRPAGWLVRTAFAHASRLLPLRRVDESRNILVFHHPRPIATPHLLLVPKRAIRGLLDVAPGDAPTLTELVTTGQRLAPGRHDLLLVINGGASQDVAQLHAHLLPASAVTPSAFPTRIDIDEALGWPLWSTVKRTVATRGLAGAGFSLVLDLTGAAPARLLCRSPGPGNHVGV